MRTDDAIKHFGGKNQLAHALGIKTPSIYGWGESVPPLRQLQLEALTSGALIADASLKKTPSPSHDGAGGKP